MRFSNAGVTIELSRDRRRRFRDLPIIPCWPPPLGRRTRPEPLTLKRLAAARLVFILGMSSSQGGRLYSIRPANGALFLHPRYGFWIGAGARVEGAPGNRSAACPTRRVAAHLASVLQRVAAPVTHAPTSGFFEGNRGFWTLTPGLPSAAAWVTARLPDGRTASTGQPWLMQSVASNVGRQADQATFSVDILRPKFSGRNSQDCARWQS